jgi:hypothetical protein
MSAIWRGFGQEVVHAGLRRNRRRRQRVVAGDHHRSDAHRTQRCKPLADAAFDDVLEVHDAERLIALGDDERRPAFARDAIDLLPHFDRQRPTLLGKVTLDRIGRPFADPPAVEIDARHAGLRREGNERRFVRRELASANPVLLLREHDDGAAFGRFVGERGELGGVGKGRVADARRGPEFAGLTVPERDRARLVEQQRMDVAGGFDGAPGHGEHIALDEPVHAGNADGRQQAADRRRNQADEERDQDEHCLRRAGVDRERLQRHNREQKDDRQTREEDVQRDFVGRLLPFGAFDQRDHTVEERVAGIGRDAHLDPVREHACAPRDRRSIAAGFTNDGRRFTRDCRLVDRCHAFDDFPVAGDELPGLDHHQVALAQARRVHGGDGVIRAELVRHRLGPRTTQGLGLRLAAPFRHGLGEVREHHGQPEPERDLELEPQMTAARDGVPDERQRREHAAHFDDEHHGILRHRSRMELHDGVDRGAAHDRGVPDGFAFPAMCRHVRTPCRRTSSGARRLDRG